jgi:bacterioferritin
MAFFHKKHERVLIYLSECYLMFISNEVPNWAICFFITSFITLFNRNRIGGSRAMTDELVNLLNETIAMELGASIRYMWQYVILESTVNPILKDTFKDSSIEKLKRGMALGERLFSLEGVPTTQPSPVNIGSSLKEMIELDLTAENDVISTFKEIIGVATKKKDTDTHLLCEKILGEEEQLKRVLVCELGRLHTKLIK